MTLAGVWRDAGSPLTMHIDGQDPSYAFRTELMGSLLSQGSIQLMRDGTYLASGQGLNGAVRVKMWLAQPNMLQAQNLVQIDGGILDNMLSQFVPNMAALQPVATFWRQQQFAAARQPSPENYDVEKLERRTERKQKKAEARAEQVAQAATREREQHKPAPPAKQESLEDPMVELNKLVGMSAVKAQLEQLEAWAWRQQQAKSHQLVAKAPSLHMCFSGGPGTGKTTVARIIGRLLRKYDLLETGELHEVSRSDLVGEYIGQTSPKTEKVIESALGGVLFIDEAYALSEPGSGGGARDYGAESLAILITGMENHRHELCVIVAGYPAEMTRFIDANAGLASRISRHIMFPDFTDAELQEVFEAMAAAEKLEIEPRILAGFQSYMRRTRSATKAKQWGNARTVRNVLERGIENQSLRLRKAGGKPTRQQLLRLELADFSFMND